MKACLDLTGLATPDRFRGIGRYAAGLAAGLARTNRGGDGGPELTAMITDGSKPKVVPLDQGLAWAADPPRLFDNFTAYNLWKRARFPSALGRAGADLLHTPDPKGAPRLGGGRAVVVTCHDLIPYMLGSPYLPRMWPRPAQRAVEWVRYRLPHHVIAISDHTRRDLQQVTGLPDDRVTVIHHGIDRDIFSPEPDAGDTKLVEDMVGAKPYLLYVGAFDPRRQVKLLLSAFARAAVDIPDRLVLVGSPYAGQLKRLDALLQRLGMTERVVLAERVPERTLTALYRQATAHVMLSRYEGFGMTLFEAMACGCPVVALDASCCGELCGDGALLLPPSAGPERVAAELTRVATDDGLRRDLTARGLARVTRFTWSRCAQETRGVYNQVLGSRS